MRARGRRRAPASDLEDRTCCCPFEVAEGTTRVEVGYEWADVRLHADGDERHGARPRALGRRRHRGRPTPSGAGRAAVRASPPRARTRCSSRPTTAERGFVAGADRARHLARRAGRRASSPPGGATYEVTVTCRDADEGPPAEPRPGRSRPRRGGRAPGGTPATSTCTPTTRTRTGLAGQEMVDVGRGAGLDFIPVTEYVTPAPLDRAGPGAGGQPRRRSSGRVGRSSPTRATPSCWARRRATVEYRSRLRRARRSARSRRPAGADGALFGIAHPTIFPGEAGAELCRGCEFTLEDEIELVGGRHPRGGHHRRPARRRLRAGRPEDGDGREPVRRPRPSTCGRSSSPAGNRITAVRRLGRQGGRPVRLGRHRGLRRAALAAGADRRGCRRATPTCWPGAWRTAPRSR